jgi:hypothetical protein
MNSRTTLLWTEVNAGEVNFQDNSRGDIGNRGMRVRSYRYG